MTPRFRPRPSGPSIVPARPPIDVPSRGGVRLIKALLGAAAAMVAAPFVFPGHPAESVSGPSHATNRAVSTSGWLYARSGGTAILSRLSARETRLYLEDLLVFQNFVRSHYPEAALPADWPLVVVLCNSTQSFHAFGGQELRTSSVLPGSRHLILVDGAESSAIEKSIRRRYVALAFDQQPLGRYPLWRQWATREILAGALIGKKHVQLGTLGSSSFLPGPMIGLDRLLAITPESPEAQPRPDGTSGPAYHQAKMFMHLCLFGTAKYHPELREPFQRFAERLERDPLSEPLFQECFGMGYAEMHAVLRGYMNAGRSPPFKIHRYRYLPVAPVEIQPARPEEVLLVWGEARASRSPAFATASEP
jgi:hypothetical protein